MALEKDKIEDVLKKLPDELQNKVLKFAKSLLQRTLEHPDDLSENATPSVRSFFGAWNSGDVRSADNDRLDSDLAREYANSHEADS